MRRQGILLPISSVPSKYGIGTFGRESYRFVDFLEKSGNRLWQILPLVPVGNDGSPYRSESTFAGNVFFIDPELLIEEGLLTREECDSFDFGDNDRAVDYIKMGESREKLLRIAWNRAREKELDKTAEYKAFLKENALWLEDYALFRALKNYFGGVSFLEWEDDIRLRKKTAVKKYKTLLAEEIAFCQYEQYLFMKQWKELKDYANERDIEIVGDLPIYVALESADTWANPELFQLDSKGYPTGVAGVPPDYFSATGQLWGNPLYDWDYHKETGYDWWMRRIAHCFELYDMLRIDHFRAFDEYWYVPAEDDTAMNGHWVPGPGYEFFEIMEQKLGKKQVIAEDLGSLTDTVLELLEKTGYPGMKILQFAFTPDEESAYLPHNHIKNCIVYTGTHDNNTTRGWVDSMSPEELRYVQEYLNEWDFWGLHWQIVRTALASVADTAIIPMQDYLGLGSDARMNTPSTVDVNWKWRMGTDGMSDELAASIKKFAVNYTRI